MEKKYTVFIVDDDPDDIEILTAAFDAVGCAKQLLSFCSGTELITSVEALDDSSLPNLIVLDNQLAGMESSDLVAQLRSSDKYSNVAIAVYSTSISPQKITQLENQGVDLCLAKGNSHQEIQQQILKFCQLIEERIML